jgi:hypothetical protein
MIRAVAASLIAATALWGAPAAAQDVLLRSDLPLWTGEEDDLYPKNFYEADSFGCISNIRTGDFRMTETFEGGETSETWYRVHNYGVFHCALVIRSADEQAALDIAPREFFWVVVLDKVRTDAGEIELLAFQQGARGGSTYVLFSRTVGAEDPGLTLLNPECPASMVRGGQPIDVWRTDYCVVPDQRALRRIARAAAGQAPVGRLEWVEDLPRPAEDQP